MGTSWACFQATQNRNNSPPRGPGFQPDRHCACDNHWSIYRAGFIKQRIVSWSNDQRIESRWILWRRQQHPPGSRKRPP
jgi:hypothetical protein